MDHFGAARKQLYDIKPKNLRLVPTALSAHGTPEQRLGEFRRETRHPRHVSNPSHA